MGKKEGRNRGEKLDGLNVIQVESKSEAWTVLKKVLRLNLKDLAPLAEDGL